MADTDSTFPVTKDSVPLVDVDNPQASTAINAVEGQLFPELNEQAVAYAATITPDPSLGDLIVVGALTGAITINNPVTAPTTGRKLTVVLIQDATGGRVVTWGSKFQTKQHALAVAQAMGTLSAVAANTSAEQTVTVGAELQASDLVVAASKPTAQAGLGIVGVRNAGTNAVGVTFGNFTTASITPTAAQTYTLEVVKVSGQPSQAASAKSVFEFEYDKTADKYVEVAAALGIA